MQSSFDVVIRDGRQPVRGVAVRVQRWGSDVPGAYWSGTTGDDGKVRVATLPEGQYGFEAEYLGLLVASECFRVGRRPPIQAKRSMRYDIGDGVPEVGAVQGEMLQWLPGRDGGALQRQLNPRRVPIMGKAIRLRDGANPEGQNELSGIDGAFSFPRAQPGLFTLTVPDGSDLGEAAVTLLFRSNHEASRKRLRLSRRIGSAGSYGPGMDVE